MKNWTIAKRITSGGAMLLLLLLIVGAVAVTALTRLESYAESRLRDDAIPGLVHAAELTSQSLRGYIRILMASNSPTATKRDENIKKSDENVANAAKAFEEYEKSITVELDRQNAEDLKKKRAAFLQNRDTYLALLKADKKAEADAFEQQTLEPSYFTFREQITKIEAWNQEVAFEVAREMAGTAKQARTLATGIGAFSILAAVALGWLIIRSTNSALQKTAAHLDDSAAQVAAAANQVSSGSQSLAHGASEQASSLEESSSSLEELSSMTKRNADSAVSAKTFSAEARVAADEGNNHMIEMRGAMDAIKTSSNDIAKIIKTIDEIAFQTNILALNAAVEAARAGAAGAGFAVVADEVRALAQRSATSAKETASKIEVAIQNSDQGVRISEKVANSLGTILEKARKVDDLVAEISTASAEQNQGISQINTAVSQMDKITQSNAANAEETAAAAEELTAQSASLKETVVQLRLLVGGSSAEAHTLEQSASRPVATPPPAARTPSARPTVRLSGIPMRRQAAGQPAAHATAEADTPFFKDV
jgi:methyl-accepting chemotaxis protein